MQTHETRASEHPTVYSIRVPGTRVHRHAFVGVFITAGLVVKAVCWVGGGQCRTCAVRYDKPRHVWTSLPITH